jgi:hypothetical protein
MLGTSDVELAITVVGGHMAPVTFFPHAARSIRPYAVAPWATESLPAGTPSVIAVLRGDFFCSAFGANEESVGHKHLPLHGETANDPWQGIARAETSDGAWMQLGMDLPVQGGSCEVTTALINGQSVIYQRHDFRGLTGPINPGHHATLRVSDRPGAAQLSFSRLSFAGTYSEPLEPPSAEANSCLAPDAEILDLRRAACVDGSTTDLTRYPARAGYEDVAILCADPELEFAWSAVCVPEQGYVWFSLRNPRQLTCTLLWFSNGGRRYAPWSGRHVNVLGVEDMTGFFHLGLAASCRPNALNTRGVRTFLEPIGNGHLSIPYLQGVVHVPAGFDRVASIHAAPAGNGIVLHAESGAIADARCDLGFLGTGQLRELDIPGSACGPSTPFLPTRRS